MFVNAKITPRGNIEINVKSLHKVLSVNLDFSKGKEWKSILSKIDGHKIRDDLYCFLCTQDFSDDESLSLIVLNGTKNRVCCGSCGLKIQESKCQK